MTIDEQIQALSDAAETLRQLRDQGHDLQDHPDYLEALGPVLTEVAHLLDRNRILRDEPLRAYARARAGENSTWATMWSAEDAPTAADILHEELAVAVDYAERLIIDPIYALDPRCDNPDCPRCNGSDDEEPDDLEDDPDNPPNHQEEAP